MKLKTLLVFNAIVALVYGIGLVLAPKIVLALHGIIPSSAGAVLTAATDAVLAALALQLIAGAMLAGQFFGATLIGIGLLVWFARNVADAGAQRAIVLAQLIATVIGVIVAVLGTLSGVMNALGWLAAGIYLVLALGYGYFQFAKPRAS